MSTEVYKIQVPNNRSMSGTISKAMMERAYEVYIHLYGKSQSLERMNERGGLSVGEVMAFLYAHSYPQSEWRERSHEGFKDMDLEGRR